MKISVCMGIYNGERYIEEQLASIMSQTMRPDEVILCDDCSTDCTVQVVRKFIEENHLVDKWKLLVNQENKGYPGNFYHAMSLCTGDIVFLADQDDIWNLGKVERMAETMQQHLEIKCICCKFGLIDSVGSDIHTFMAPSRNHGTGKLCNVTAEDVFYKCEWPGMVLAYRNTWYQTFRAKLQGRENTWQRIPHDFLLCAKAGEEHGFYQMDEELACHRRHDSNAGGEEHKIFKLLDKQRKMKEINDYMDILQAFVQGDVMETREGKTALWDKLESMKGRLTALQSGKISKVLMNAWRNRRNVRLVTVICDVVIVKKKG